jgi:hypothetical protein
MTNKEIETLLSQGYVELPDLCSTEDPKEIISAKHSGTYSSASEFQNRYHDTIGLNKIIKQLSDIASSNFNKKVDHTDVYKILRVVQSSNIKESYRMHFDSHLFTLVTPVVIPKVKSSESGQLITFPNLRVEPIGEIYNIISKLYYKFFITGKKNVTKFSGKFKAVEFDFSDNIPILFLGRATLHGNRGFAEVPDGIRITMLTHFFDPSPTYGIGNLIRLIRNR